MAVSALSSAAHAAGRPASPAWHSSPVHWYSLSYKQPLPLHGSSTPQRTLPSAAHTFVASCHVFGAKFDTDLRSPAKHWPSASFRVQVLALKDD